MSGIKPQRKVKIKWSSDFAYAIGLLTTDGCLLNDGRHIDLTSKDKEQLQNFKQCLGIQNKIGKKVSGHSDKQYFRVQFGDVVFYRFLEAIGLHPAKSKSLVTIRIPNKYFFDFLRGEFDGDGHFYSYYDPRWKSSYMFYTVFNSASKNHILWIRKKLDKLLSIKGHLNYGGGGIHQLKYAKQESLILLEEMYHSESVICLSRKRLKIKKALDIIGVTL